MFFVYILKSKKDKKTLYTGYTSNLRKRFKEHNLGPVGWTKSKRPWQLVYYEAYTSRQDAQKREENLKLRAKAQRQLLNRIKKSLEA